MTVRMSASRWFDLQPVQAREGASPVSDRSSLDVGIGMRVTRRRNLTALACPVVMVSACTATQSPPPEPWSDRPVVELRFEVADDLTSVAGWERVTFAPDLPTCEVVFRAWPNKPITALTGSSLVVSEVRLDGRPVEPVDVAAGAPEDAPAGTLLEIPLEGCVDAGDEVTVELAFDLELGEDADERMGSSTTTDVAWFATAFPLLAWERGRGWERGPAVPVDGEMAVSEDFVLDRLVVVAPSSYDVLGTGKAFSTDEGPDGTTVHRFIAPAVRDVAVSVGDLDVVEDEIDGVRVHLGMDRSVEQSAPSDWLDQIGESMRDLVDLLGPFPYDDLWVTVLSSQTSGIEFPGVRPRGQRPGGAPVAGRVLRHVRADGGRRCPARRPRVRRSRAPGG
jgi:hypothetical protein